MTNGRLSDLRIAAEVAKKGKVANHVRALIVPGSLYLGAHANWRAEFGRAVSRCQDAEHAAQEIHDGFNELWALSFRCLALIDLGEHREALTLIRHGLDAARDRSNAFVFGRLHNTLGWLYQELGDFRQALGYDLESAKLGHRDQIAHVEISALINVGYDYLKLGEPQRALALFEDMLNRVEHVGFGSHRWLWSRHLSSHIAETLFAMGNRARAVSQTEKALAQAVSTRSMKYVAKVRALRGEIALSEGQWNEAEAECGEALRIAQEIRHPTIIWQAAHLLAQAYTGQNKLEGASAAVLQAVHVLDTIATHIPEPTTARAFDAWARTQAVREDLDRIKHAASFI